MAVAVRSSPQEGPRRIASDVGGSVAVAARHVDIGRAGGKGVEAPGQSGGYGEDEVRRPTQVACGFEGSAPPVMELVGDDEVDVLAFERRRQGRDDADFPAGHGEAV